MLLRRISQGKLLPTTYFLLYTSYFFSLAQYLFLNMQQAISMIYPEEISGQPGLKSLALFFSLSI